MPTESITRTMARMLGSNLLFTLAKPTGRTVAINHGRAKVGELLRDEWRAGVMGRDAAMLRREAERHGHLEFGERVHLPVEPVHRLGRKLSAQDRPVRR